MKFPETQCVHARPVSCSPPWRDMPFRRGRQLANILQCSGFQRRIVRGRRCGRRRVRQAADGLSSPSPSSLVLGLWWPAWSAIPDAWAGISVLQLGLQALAMSEADLGGRLAIETGMVDGFPTRWGIRTLDGRLLACSRSYLEGLRMTREQVRGTL